MFWDESEDNLERKKTVLNVMYFVSLNTIKMFAPFLPFITEELYLSFYKRYEKDKSIHVSPWPEYRSDLVFNNALKYSTILLNILDASRKFRTNLNLHQNHKVHKILIQALNQDYIEIINDISNDIKSAVRAERLIFSDKADFKTLDDNILIALEK